MQLSKAKDYQETLYDVPCDLEGSTCRSLCKYYRGASANGTCESSDANCICHYKCWNVVNNNHRAKILNVWSVKHWIKQ